ncbi:50S ribosomal protein L29 [bacterium]|nr:50S ribosomal protein L29 [bacterium]|tara:strand:- start:366 stop:602 length:237 start_codon:yes stop_codon:yes gene_type:complete
MKKKQLKEFKTKTKGEIKKELSEERKRLAGLRDDLAMGKVKNIREIRDIKKSIAQLLAVLTEKDLSAQAGEKTSNSKS